ncbi:MAG: NUDIX domain-containing protein [Pseudolactococcus laudensis]|uniref:NUDIX domain-containing protein n=1 Tax=Pseudolactococcus laudensis TaxID=1494461 RepID=UPI003F9BCB35
MTQDLTVDIAEGRLNIRVAAIIQQDDKILVSQLPNGTISLVGGRVVLGETTQAAISREVAEETGLIVEAASLCAMIENYFKYDDTFYHEFLYVYNVTTNTLEFDQSAPDFESQDILWLPISESASLQPEILSDVVRDKRDQILHLVNQEANLVS